MLSQHKKPKKLSYQESRELSVQYVKYSCTVSVIWLCSADLKKEKIKPCETNLIIQGSTLAYLRLFDKENKECPR